MTRAGTVQFTVDLFRRRGPFAARRWYVLEIGNGSASIRRHWFRTAMSLGLSALRPFSIELHSDTVEARLVKKKYWMVESADNTRVVGFGAGSPQDHPRIRSALETHGFAVRMF